ncbi:hypothetical protein KSS87_006157 [Heliosperma pusillum]|nr:hypothetical protein KSS87_006157 [Heliosperma pusillum]
MANDEHESESNENSNSENESETLEIDSTTPTNYEKQRQARIAANNARMKALGLHNLANSLISTPPNPKKPRNSANKSKNDVQKKGKGNDDDDDDDDEYEPDCDRNDGDGESNSSSDDDDDDFEEEEETFVRRNKFNPKKKVKKSSSSKQVPISNPTDFSVFMDEDEALKQALALSLKDLGDNPDLQHGKSPQSSKKRTTSIKEKSRDHFHEDNTYRRKRKLFTSRVQMTDDDLVIHFCQIDEVGKGGITVRDVERMAATHDFNWTDKELSDMIRCFDSDRDGKTSFTSRAKAPSPLLDHLQCFGYHGPSAMCSNIWPCTDHPMDPVVYPVAEIGGSSPLISNLRTIRFSQKHQNFMLTLIP